MKGLLVAVVAATTAAIAAACAEPGRAGILDSFTGAGSGLAAPDCFLVGDAGRWAAVWEEHAPGTDAPAVDFREAVVVGVLSDFGISRSSFTAELVPDAGEHRLRYRHAVPQIKGEAQRAATWGFFVLPRDALPVVVEEGAMADKLGETIWEERARFE